MHVLLDRLQSHTAYVNVCRRCHQDRSQEWMCVCVKCQFLCTYQSLPGHLGCACILAYIGGQLFIGLAGARCGDAFCSIMSLYAILRHAAQMFRKGVRMQ
jgi:Leu/Phe-tRNA-protein transferase